MITIGVDPHKRENEAVVLDEQGRVVERWRGANDRKGWEALKEWAEKHGDGGRPVAGGSRPLLEAARRGLR